MILKSSSLDVKAVCLDSSRYKLNEICIIRLFNDKKDLYYTLTPNSQKISSNEYRAKFNISNIPDGEYKVEVLKDYFAPLAKTIIIKNGKTDLDLIRIFIYGDMNHDGEVSDSDVATIKSLVAEDIQVDDYDRVIADCNKDGELNSKDITFAKRILAKLSTPK